MIEILKTISPVDGRVYVERPLETGTVFLNRRDDLDPALAWSGVKKSGRGCTLSRLGFEQLTHAPPRVQPAPGAAAVSPRHRVSAPNSGRGARGGPRRD